MTALLRLWGHASPVLHAFCGVVKGVCIYEGVSSVSVILGISTVGVCLLGISVICR